VKKLLIIGEFPAPYRVEVFAGIARKWNSKIYFEIEQDAQRTQEWLSRIAVDCEMLSTKKGKKQFWNDVKFIKDFDAAIIYNNSLKYSILLELICKIRRIPFFLNCDGCNDIEESNPLKKAVKCFLMRGATGYFAGGQSAVKYFEYYGADSKRIHLHNFTSLHQEDINKKLLTDAEKNCLKEKIGMTGKFNVVTVGRHIECKGFDIVLKASEIGRAHV